MGVFNKLELPCIHLGPPTGEVRDCASCGGKKAVPVFACAKYGRCSPGDRLVYREDNRNVEVAWCRTCPSYENPNVPVAAVPVLSGVAPSHLLVAEKAHLYKRNADGDVLMETHFPGVMQTRPDGSIHWLSPPQQRPAMLTMMEARAMGLSPLGSGPGADPNCNGCSCGGGVGPCCGCTTTKSVWSFTLSGVTNGTGLPCPTCTSFNTTWTLNYNTVNTCEWDSADLCGFGPIWILFCADANNPNSWILQASGVQQATPVVYKLAESSWACNGTNVMSKIIDTGACSGFPATVTIS